MRYMKIFFNFIIFLVSFLIPKSSKYVIVGGWYGKRYADNSKGIYEYLNAHKTEFGLKRVFWYTNDEEIYKELKDKGLDVLIGFSVKSAFYHFRSKTHFIDQTPRDILGFLSVRCTRINMWHGLPLKKIGHLISGRNAKFSFWDKMASGGCWLDQYILATSDLACNLLTKAMGIDKEKCIIASYPRTNLLYSIKAKKKNQDKLFVFYLPTLRDKKERNPLLDVDLADLNSVFNKNDIIFQLKPHPASIGDWASLASLSNFRVLDSSVDVYDILVNTDLLITDYSSVYFDYMLTGKAILFFPYDYNEYIAKDRGFNLPYNQFTPGDKVFSIEKLVSKIIEIRNDYMTYQKKHLKKYSYVNEQVNQYRETPNYIPIINVMLSPKL